MWNARRAMLRFVTSTLGGKPVRSSGFIAIHIAMLLGNFRSGHAFTAGVAVARVEIDKEGKIVVVFGTGSDNLKLNSADAVLEKLEKAKHEHGKS